MQTTIYNNAKKTMYKTADLWDQNANQLHCIDPVFRSFGNKISFYGKIKTLKLFEDNSFVRHALEKDGTGYVLVIDGGGSLRCALLGDQLSELAIQNNWSGIIIYGCIRDSALINNMEIGIRALNTTPVKSIKRNMGQTDLNVTFRGATFIPDQFVYVDADGIVISEHEINLTEL